MSNDIRKFSDTTVLVVDDIETNRVILGEIIEDMGCQAILSENGVEALKQIAEHLPALVLTDISMPSMDGFELCRILKEKVETRAIPIIFISAFDDPKDIVKGFDLGCADYVTKPFIPEVVQSRVGAHLRLYEATREIKEANRRLQLSIKEQLWQLEQERKKVLYALANVAAEQSYYGVNYIERLKYNCRILVQSMQFSPVFEDQISDSFIDAVEFAASLCDIGNVGIGKAILQKSTALSSDEIETMQSHTRIGAKLLKDLQVTNDYNDLGSISIEVALSHHENWDGSGYPQGLAGDKIPLSARIVSVVGVYCALTERRSYREKYDKEKAFEIMKQDAERKFQPEIFQIFCRVAQQLR